MNLGFLGPLFWGLLLLSALVFVHEGGHFLAARLCGVRVREFFLGMPCRLNIHHVSRRIGTKFGVTPILIGGYAEICGMDPTDAPCAPRVLGAVHRHGVARVDDLATELVLSDEEVDEACRLLYGWGSIVPCEQEVEGDGEVTDFPRAFCSMPRDADGNTVYDGRLFDRAHATATGEPWIPPAGDEAFFASERSRTYIGKGFLKRAFMLVAGIAVNLLTGFLLVIAVYSVLGVTVPVDANVVGEVVEDSRAQKAGLVQGDRILSVDGVEVDSWTGLIGALDGARGAGEADLEIWRPDEAQDAFESLSDEAHPDEASWASAHGTFSTITVEFDADGMLGINAPTRTVRLDPLQSCQIALENIVATAQSVASLLNPAHTMQVLDNSTSVVGISIMSAEAAAAGPATFLNLAALISFSLGFMNLLPIPPLDGGKLVVEAIQAITRRTVSMKVQTVLSMVGIALFGLLFVYMLGADIMRFV